jgi:pantoate--beta-alanine ligase
MRTEPGDPVELIHRVEDMRRWAQRQHSDGHSIGLVPTMGYLHEGHLSLIDRARSAADLVVVSVFVNPTQFGPGEDLERYPRDLGRDCRLAARRGSDLVFAPTEPEMYPSEQTIWVDPGALADCLCGASRPGHFRGVLTVVLKLFEMVQPDVAVFGQKDYQQALLIRRMVEELAVPIEVDIAPIVRERDGLAMSSRNAYLVGEDRERALSLSRAIEAVRTAFAGGVTSVPELIEAGRAVLDGADARIDYIEVVHPEDLEPLKVATAEAVCLVAAWIGDTRLIDNGILAGDRSVGRSD